MELILKNIFQRLKTDENLEFTKSLIDLLIFCYYRSETDIQNKVSELIKINLKKAK